MSDTITAHVADRLNLNAEQTERVLRTLAALIKKQSARDGRVRVPGLGVFTQVEEQLDFQPDLSLSQAVNYKFAGLESVSLQTSEEAELAEVSEPEDTKTELVEESPEESAESAASSQVLIGMEEPPAIPFFSPPSEEEVPEEEHPIATHEEDQPSEDSLVEETGSVEEESEGVHSEPDFVDTASEEVVEEVTEGEQEEILVAPILQDSEAEESTEADVVIEASVMEGVTTDEALSIQSGLKNRSEQKPERPKDLPPAPPLRRRVRRQKRQQKPKMLPWVLIILFVGIVAAGSYYYFFVFDPGTSSDDNNVRHSTSEVTPPPSTEEQGVASEDSTAVVDSSLATAAPPPEAQQQEEQPEPEQEAPTSDVFDIARGGYALIVGSRTSLAGAETLADRYRQRINDATIPVGLLSGVDGNGVTRYRVAVGQVSTIPEANQLKTQLGDVIPADAWIRSVQADN